MLPIRGLKVRIADTLQEWSESLKNLKTPNSFRQYVDDLFERVNPDLFMPKAGGTFTGPVYMAGEAENDVSPTTLAQVRAMIEAMPHQTQQQILQWIAAEIAKIPATDTSTLMPKSGGTFTDAVTMAGDATQALQPTTLQQVQAMVSGIAPADLSGLMPKSGGTFTGAVNLAANAANPLEPVSLQQLQDLLAALPAVPTSYPFDMNFSSGGQILPGDFINVFIAQRQITIPQSLVKCSARAIGAAGNQKASEIDLLVNGTKVLTVTFAKSVQDGVFSLTTAGQDIVIPVSAVVTLQANATNYDTTMSYPVIAITGTTPTT